MHCKHCKASDCRKEGITRDARRPLCQACGKRFIVRDARHIHDARVRVMALISQALKLPENPGRFR